MTSFLNVHSSPYELNGANIVCVSTFYGVPCIFSQWHFGFVKLGWGEVN